MHISSFQFKIRSPLRDYQCQYRMALHQIVVAGCLIKENPDAANETILSFHDDQLQMNLCLGLTAAVFLPARLFVVCTRLASHPI